MGDGDSGDTLGKGFGKYLQEEEESRYGQNRQSTFAFLEEAGLTNSPIQDGVESEQEEDSQVVMNMGNLVQSGSIKYLENDLLKEVVQTIRSTVHDQNGVC